MRLKMKTNRSVAKRFRVTRNGKLVYQSANRNHKNYHKSSSRKRRLNIGSNVSSADKPRIKRALGI